MQRKTYLNGSIKNGNIMRWPVNNLTVYIAPMKFYSKPGEDAKYRKMVMDAFSMWSAATGGKLRFRITSVLLESNINVDWKRVDRQALGHCYFSWDPQGRLYGAEVSIGLTDGRIHKKYDSDIEVYHTILHEVGHALGLNHSPYKEDIMYTPHQKGINSISEGDRLTVNWLNTLPQGANTAEVSSKYGIGGSNIDEIIAKFIDRKSPTEFEKVKASIKMPKRDLLEEQETLANLRKYHMALQNVQISEDMKKFFNSQKKN